MHKTLVVHNRFAWRSYRTRAALDGSQGVVLLTIEQLAARLAGGFLQPINSDDLKTAVASAVSQPLGELGRYQEFTGFPTSGSNEPGQSLVSRIELRRRGGFYR